LLVDSQNHSPKVHFRSDGSKKVSSILMILNRAMLFTN
jgi:hypothetical protein